MLDTLVQDFRMYNMIAGVKSS